MGLGARTDLLVGMWSVMSYLQRTSVVPETRSAVDSNKCTAKDSSCNNYLTLLLNLFLY
jgi:hypothetical protein